MNQEMHIYRTVTHVYCTYIPRTSLKRSFLRCTTSLQVGNYSDNRFAKYTIVTYTILVALYLQQCYCCYRIWTIYTNPLKT